MCVLIRGVLRINLAGAAKREKGYRDASEDLKHDVTVARTAYTNAERSITEHKAKILALNRQLASLNQERTDLGRELRTALEMLSTVAAEMVSSSPTIKLCLDTDSAKDQCESSPDGPKKSDQEKPDPESLDQDNPDQGNSDQDMSDPGTSDQNKSDPDQPDHDPDYTPTPNGSDGSSSNDKRQDLPPGKQSRASSPSHDADRPSKRKHPMTEDHKKDLDREENPDNYDMGGGSDVEETPDPGHAFLDVLLEKDRGAASPVPTPEPRYLSYEKDGSKNSGVPASSDPASKSKSKSKPRSTSDPKSSKDENLETEDQESDADTSAEDQSRGAAITLLLIVPVLAELEILDRAVIEQTRQYNIADVNPWVIQRINTLTIMTMTLEVLSRALPFRPEWIFPSHISRVATPRSDQYCSHFITGQNVRDLMAALPWNVLTGANISEPMSFEITVDGRLGFLIEGYSAVEFQDLIAYWESTHHFPVSPALVRSVPYLALFVVKRKNRRPHAGARRKEILQLFLIDMREGWCDLDLLLAGKEEQARLMLFSDHYMSDGFSGMVVLNSILEQVASLSRQETRQTHELTLRPSFYDMWLSKKPFSKGLMKTSLQYQIQRLIPSHKEILKLCVILLQDFYDAAKDLPDFDPTQPFKIATDLNYNMRRRVPQPVEEDAVGS
ncbi:hypothetical protein PHMEG_0009166 [Phytophthora megakarya]|uniref:Uncharacterized protein n=1 Tax=Phytophthora megakarya TaxID=4795 RepID=A0A225WHS0_9STRA|nr:hypothetical protein PHMEG_0009166 [Phytophthora megakarya]